MRVGLVCPRQNGKNAVIEARALAGLFILGERLIVYSAHLGDTANEVFRRFQELVETNDWIAREVKAIHKANGKEAIELRSGQRIKFKTRTASSARGLSGDLVFFDEAMILPEASHASAFPIISARPNPQVWYTGSAVNEDVHQYGRVLTAVREGAISGDADSLAYFEWSIDKDDPADLTISESLDETLLAQANPALGRRISLDYLRQEQEAFLYDLASIAGERLGIGRWPALSGDSGVITSDVWNRLIDVESSAEQVCFGFDVSPNRSTGAISVAGRRSDGRMHVGVVESGRGTGWMIPHLAELATKNPIRFVCDSASPAASLVPELEQAGIEVEVVPATGSAQAYGMFIDAVYQDRLRHRGTQDLAAAVRGAKERRMGEAAAWGRRTSISDITPLVAATLALWAAATADVYKEPFALWR
jgi:hypothetical protein